VDHGEDRLRMTIRFMQFLRPNGKARSVYIERPAAVEAKAIAIQDAGYWFEAEVLRGGEVSLTIADLKHDAACEICENGEEVPKAIDRLIMNFRI
jgi:hypothetical protein